jgi:hypothetical protein
LFLFSSATQSTPLTVDTVPQADLVDVYKIRPLDADRHAGGEGRTAVCLSPLFGDVYAPYLRHYLAYYREVLLVDKFFLYLTDPGPASLEVIQELVAEYGDNMELVRFALPREYLASEWQSPFAEHPSSWNLSAIEPIPEMQEDTLGAGSPSRYDIWYGGQVVAVNDCGLRAMRDGIRWVMNVDWDEYLIPVPPNKSDWQSYLDRTTPSPIHPLVSALAIAGRQAFDIFKPVRAEASLLASAYQFRSTYVYTDAKPSSSPDLLPSDLSLRQLQGDDLSVSPLLTWSVREPDWWPAGERCKTVSLWLQ